MDLVSKRGPEDEVSGDSQGDLASYPPDGRQQQEAVWAVAATDAYQWGYDPVHWGVPEGSYASDADGPARIVEFR